jgi:hypothetical protein
MARDCKGIRLACHVALGFRFALAHCMAVIRQKGGSMKAFAIGFCLLAFWPLQATALNTSYDNDLLSTIAMPLAVSAVCDVRGVQTDRVGELVTYMDEANVAPADFVDVFRYVPVALVMRTDRQPDFVEWTHQQVINGVDGPELVTVMERKLRTYDSYVPVVSSYRTRRHIDYGYRYAFNDEYVPVVIRHHCDRLLLDPFALIEMPIAVANVYDIGGLPYDRVSDLVVELNLGDVPPVQFVEVMRYAPVAVVQADFVPWVRTERIGGLSGFALVGAIDQQLVTYNVAPQIDLVSPVYYSQPNYYPQVVNYVAPVDPAFVPQVVQTRIAAAPTFATSPVATSPQVQRLLAAQSEAVVANPGQARRELARENRIARETPPMMSSSQIATAPTPMIEHGHGRGHVMATPSAPTFAPPMAHGNGRQRHFEAPAAVPNFVAPQQHGRGHENHVAGPQPVVAGPQPVQVQREHGNGNGRGHGRAVMAMPPMVAHPAPVAQTPPAAVMQEHGHGNGHGRGGPPVVMAPAPAPTPATAPQNGPPGQEKNKGKGKHQ